MVPAVFVANASMFTVFWSILMIGAAMLARRRDIGGACSFARCTFHAADFFVGVQRTRAIGVKTISDRQR
jgi:hypothetical protein